MSNKDQPKDRVMPNATAKRDDTAAADADKGAVFWVPAQSASGNKKHTKK